METLDDVASLLRRSNELLEILARHQLSSVLESELQDTKKQQLYKLTGTPAAIKELSVKVGMSTGAISKTWQRWELMGILVKEKNHYRRVFR